MNCPQCNAGLGEGAKGCAACGWSASKKTLWIVLGSIAGFLLLVCCGAGTYGWMKVKKAAEAIQDSSTPVVVSYHRVAVLNFAKKRGALPKTLAQAGEEKLEVKKKKEGDPGQVSFQMQQNGQEMDGWQRPLRYTVQDEKTYEVRSAGKDGVFDNEDDIIETGSTDDDLDAEMAVFTKKAEQIGKDFLKALGVDPAKLEQKGGPVPPDAADPADPVEDDAGGEVEDGGDGGGDRGGMDGGDGGGDEGGEKDEGGK